MKRINTKAKRKIRAKTKTRKQRSQRKRMTYKGGKKTAYKGYDLSDAFDYVKSITIDNDLPYELCGSISKLNNEVFIHETPSLSEARANCMYDDYSDGIIWHNHPKTSKFYPSLEDILKVIKQKNDTLKMSFILTPFGYWRLETINHIDVSDKIKNDIKYWLDWLYFNTEKGRVYKEDAVNKMTENLNILLNNILTIDFLVYQ